MYDLLSVADGLAHRVSGTPDEDPERAADLHRAITALPGETAAVLKMWAEGHTLREISDRLWRVNSPNRVRRLLGEGLRDARSRMNGEQTSK